MELKTSSEQRQFNTGSVRDSAIGKPRIDLIPTSTLIKLGIHYANGASHYGDNNWKKGQPISSYLASFERHYNQFKMGITDENHLISALWNLIAIDWTLDAIKSGRLPSELDDRDPDMIENNEMGAMIKCLINENIAKQTESKHENKPVDCNSDKKLKAWQLKLKSFIEKSKSLNNLSFEAFNEKMNHISEYISPDNVLNFVDHRFKKSEPFYIVEKGFRNGALNSIVFFTSLNTDEIISVQSVVDIPRKDKIPKIIEDVLFNSLSCICNELKALNAKFLFMVAVRDQENV